MPQEIRYHYPIFTRTVSSNSPESNYNINQNAVKLTISEISLLKKRNWRTFMLLYTLSVQSIIQCIFKEKKTPFVFQLHVNIMRCNSTCLAQPSILTFFYQVAVVMGMGMFSIQCQERKERKISSNQLLKKTRSLSIGLKHQSLRNEQK